MSPFKQITDGIANANDYREKSGLAQYLCSVLENLKKPVDAQDAAFLRGFAITEMQYLLTAIPKAENYKEKDEIFAYENALLGIFSLGGKSMENVAAEHRETIKQVISLVEKERVLENAIDEMFKLSVIEKGDVEKVLAIVKPITDEYRRGLLYQGLHFHKDEFTKLTAEAKSALAEFSADDLQRLIAGADDEEKAKSLEFAADACKHYADGNVLVILEKTMTLNLDNVRYYAAETLLQNGREIPAAAINEIARNLEYAELLYGLLQRYGKTALFPAEYSSPEYLAKSDLVHWLTYPTELGKQPDKIEFLGQAKVHKENYYIFKYKSESETLDDETRGEWLIGWSGDEGGTFSNFDKLSDYEKKTPKKTLKHIVKKLLK